MAATSPLKGLVNTKERVYYSLLLLFSLAIYATLAAVVVLSAEAASGVIVYTVAIALGIFMAHGLLIGRLRGNAVRVSPRQFPRLHALVSRHAATLGLKKLPDVFVMEAGGVLNAFATSFLGRDFVVIYADVLAQADARGEGALSFVVAHELAHLRRGHLRRRWLTLPGRLVPYLGAAYSRACEYTCDRFGAHCEPQGAVDGLLVLAAGKHLFHEVDAREFARQAVSEKGFFTNRAELMSSHPHLTKRVAALLSKGVPAPAYSPTMASAAGAMAR